MRLFTAMWRLFLDCALGRVEEFEYKHSTTPDDLAPGWKDPARWEVQEDSDEVGYYRDA